jgi:hypothetical protein
MVHAKLTDRLCSVTYTGICVIDSKVDMSSSDGECTTRVCSPITDPPPTARKCEKSCCLAKSMAACHLKVIAGTNMSTGVCWTCRAAPCAFEERADNLVHLRLSMTGDPDEIVGATLIL